MTDTKLKQKSKIYKGKTTININMIPSDPKGLLDESFLILKLEVYNAVEVKIYG